MRIKQGKIEDRVREVANAYPAFLLVENRKKAVLYYWKTFDGISIPISEDDFMKATSPESITRAIRKVREEKKRYDSQAVTLEQQFRSHYSQEYKRL